MWSSLHNRGGGGGVWIASDSDKLCSEWPVRLLRSSFGRRTARQYSVSACASFPIAALAFLYVCVTASRLRCRVTFRESSTMPRKFEPPLPLKERPRTYVRKHFRLFPSFRSDRLDRSDRSSTSTSTLACACTCFCLRFLPAVVCVLLLLKLIFLTEKYMVFRTRITYAPKLTLRLSPSRCKSFRPGRRRCADPRLEDEDPPSCAKGPVIHSHLRCVCVRSRVADMTSSTRLGK